MLRLQAHPRWRPALIGEATDPIARIGRDLARRYPPAIRQPRRAAEDRLMAWCSRRPELRAALFRLVDVAPACRDAEDVARHLEALLSEVTRPPAPVSAVARACGWAPARRPLGRLAAGGVRAMASRFIAGETPADAAGVLDRLWRDGIATSVDLLGEATVTHAEADYYARRCSEAIVDLTRSARSWPRRPVLEHDGAGPLPRANLSVKVSALTPLVRPHAPQLGRDDAARRLRALLRLARERGAHLHVDMESMDSRDLVLELVLDLLAEPEFSDGPSAGVVLQGYLVDSGAALDTILAWARRTPRRQPLVVRLVKGAYWDHETADARRHGWSPPVFQSRARTDREFELLTRRLLDARPDVRVAIASHNLRSIAHAIACNRAAGGEDADLELQVLYGLGDDLARALAASGLRVRVYCPTGDLVAGMAYLVRRLLENSSNESFLAARSSGRDLDELLAAP